MPAWSTYDKASGLFAGIVIRGDIEDAHANSTGAQGCVPGEHDPLSRRVDITAVPPPDPDPWPVDADGKPLPRVPWFPPVIDYQPPAPDADQWQTWAWDAEAERWLPVPTLAALKFEKWAEIKAQRDAVEFGPFEWDGSVFDGDKMAQGRIVGKVLAATLAIDRGAAFEQTWKLADNSFRTLDATDMIAVGEALDANISTAHATAAVLWLQLQAAATAEAVAAVTWTTI